MPSVKQLSFKRGEVSPAFRYKASSVAYTEGLHKLRNGYPRRGGGISNRPGFRFIKTIDRGRVQPQGYRTNTKLLFQKRKEYLGDDTSRKHSGVLYYVSADGFVVTEVIHLFSDFSVDDTFLNLLHTSSRVSDIGMVGFEDDVYFTLRDQGILRLPYEELFEPREGQTKLLPANLRENNVRVQVESVADFFFRNDTRDTYHPALAVDLDVAIGDPINRNLTAVYIITETNPKGSERIVCVYDGPYNPFQGYKVTFTLVDSLGISGSPSGAAQTRGNWNANYKRGILFTKAATTYGVSGSAVAGANLRSDRLTNPNSPDYTARPQKGRYIYRLYRSITLGAPTALINTQILDYEVANTAVGSSNIFPTLEDFSSISGVSSRAFRDGFRLFGGVGNDTLDSRFLNYEPVARAVANGSHTLYRPKTITASGGNPRFTPFVRVRELMRYQQRTFASYIDKGPVDAENTLRSVIGVSRINSKHDFTTAPVVNPANAFEFNIPLGDVSTVVAMLGADRPLIFTQQSVYMLLGADSGIITPLEINPTVIYTGGCSDTVRPVLVDNQAFFLNNDHTSLVMIAFNASGGRGVQVIETDAFAKHFLEMEIIQIAVVKSFETLIWLLTSEGKLISMTMYEDGVFGFGLHALSDGFIENITSARYPYMYQPNIRNNAWTSPDVECLAATIVRDGKRTLEVMTGRDDRLSENMGFMDGFATFGTRLSTRDDGYNTDLANPNGRFNQVFDPSLPSELATDLNTIFEKFSNLINGYNWFQHIFSGYGQSVSERFPFSDTNALRYFSGSNFIRTPYRHARQSRATTSSVYEDITRMQRINVGERVNSETGIEYFIDFNAAPSIISLMPPALAGFGKRDEPSDVSYSASIDVLRRQDELSSGTEITQKGNFEFWDQSLYIYMMIIRMFYGLTPPATNVVVRTTGGSYDSTRDSYNALNDRQKALVDKMVTEGGILNFKAPEEVLYNGIHLRKVEQEDLRFENGMVDLSKYNLSPQYSTGQAANHIKNLHNFTTTDGRNITINVPIPLPVNRARVFLYKSPVISVQYDTIGNERIPENFINIEPRPNVTNLTTQDITRINNITTNWAGYTNQVEGLDHLAGKKVAVFADNEVISSPLSENKDVASKALTVSDAGVLKLPNYYQWGAVGLPYRFEMESLQIETQDDRALISGRKVINKLNAALHRTREGIRAAAIQGFEYDEVDDESFPMYDESVRESSIDKSNGTFSGVIDSFLSAGWSEGGRVRITHSDPTPVTVNAIYPKGIESGD